MLPNYPATTQSIAKTLYCYTNSTHELQLIRVTDSESYSLEKIVFPRQRILFAAKPQEQLEVRTERAGKQVIERVIPCRNLPANQSQQKLAFV